MIDHKDSERTIEMDDAMRQLAYAFLVKMKQIVCDNTVYTLNETAPVNFPPIRSFNPATYANAPHLVFPEMFIAVMGTIKIEKHVPPPLQSSILTTLGHLVLGMLRPFMQPYRNMLSCLARPLPTSQLPEHPVR